MPEHDERTLQLKVSNGEISTKAIDLRGFLGVIRIMKQGLRSYQAVKMGIVNKCFDAFEREIVDY